jgi:hypothetical protein
MANDIVVVLEWLCKELSGTSVFDHIALYWIESNCIISIPASEGAEYLVCRTSRGC